MLKPLPVGIEFFICFYLLAFRVVSGLYKSR